MESVDKRHEGQHESSGIIPDDYQGIEAQFTQVEELPSLGYCRLVKAMRYGRWHVLKGLKAEHSGDVAYQQRLRKEFEIMMRLSHTAIAQTYGLERGNGDGAVGASRCARPWRWSCSTPCATCTNKASCTAT